MSAFREALGNLPATVFADLLESDDAYLLVFDLPGVTEETVDVQFETGRLRVEARRAKETPEDFRYRDERRSLFLDFDVPLPVDVTGEEATASLERGVLEVRLPRGRGRHEIPVGR